MTIHCGDNLTVLPTMDADSIDAICTDPPYGLEFMGKEWDRLGERGRHTGTERKTFSDGNRDFPSDRRAMPSFGTQQRNPRCRTCNRFQWDHADRKCVCVSPQFEHRHMGNEQQAFHAAWATAALRVAKPGAYLLAFGGPRTVHRMTCAIEDAGWIIRDVLCWCYASGFPKSRSSLKPAWEPIVLARKPGPLQPLQIDAARIGYEPDDLAAKTKWGDSYSGIDYAKGHIFQKEQITPPNPAGRWPANVVLTDPIFDGECRSCGRHWDGVVGGGEAHVNAPGRLSLGESFGYMKGMGDREPFGYDADGTYSRFFLVPKSSRRDREPVMPGLLEKRDDDRDGSFGLDAARPHTKPDYVYQRKPRANGHPTVKPIELMRHLVRLVTPPGGTVLDPFAGSGTTLLAADQEGFAWVGIEREAEYVAIIEARLAGNQMGLAV